MGDRGEQRPTPARAGQPRRSGRARLPRGAYPRACGATQTIGASATPQRGLPPRVRGNRAAHQAALLQPRPTPARAGQPPPECAAACPRWAYPRACGATCVPVPSSVKGAGLPPRVRGNPGNQLQGDNLIGPTPARAGQPSRARILRREGRAYPRACGATVVSTPKCPAPNGLPPRVRGNQLCRPRQYGRAGAYPRACGATADGTCGRLRAVGLPPRVRGNHGAT